MCRFDSTMGCSGKFGALRIDGAKITKPEEPKPEDAPHDGGVDFSTAFNLTGEGDDSQGAT